MRPADLFARGRPEGANLATGKLEKAMYDAETTWPRDSTRKPPGRWCLTSGETTLWGRAYSVVMTKQTATNFRLITIALLACACTETINGCKIEPKTICPNVDLPGANLTRASLNSADMSGANLTGANVSEANLSGADLSNANLANANLRDSNLRGTYFRGVNLYGANLQKASLSRADLREADLRGANLNLVINLKEAYLKGAQYDSQTRCPRLSGRDASGATRAKLFDPIAAGAVLLEADD